jgi:hypothetical protein
MQFINKNSAANNPTFQHLEEEGNNNMANIPPWEPHKNPIQQQANQAQDTNSAKVAPFILIRSLIPIGSIPDGVEYEKLSKRETHIRMFASICTMVRNYLFWRLLLHPLLL